jgi:hypothetical protein
MRLSCTTQHRVHISMIVVHVLRHERRRLGQGSAASPGS